MADTEEPVAPRSIKDRIAALNLNKTEHQQPPSSPPPSYNQVFPEKRKAPAPPLPKRPAEHRSASTNNPPVLSSGVSSTKPIGNQPAARQTPSLPPRRPSHTPTTTLTAADGVNDGTTPSLPPRRPSEQLGSRRPSVESVASTLSVRSAGSGLSSRTSTSTNRTDGRPRVLAPEYDPASLPALPERKAKDDSKTGGDGARVPPRPSRSNTSAPVREVKAPAPALPVRSAAPALPGRPALPSRATAQRQEEPTPATSLPQDDPSTAPSSAHSLPPVRREVKAPLPRRSALDFGMNKATNTPPPIPAARPGDSDSTAPPPIPRDSRPDLAALQASKPKPGATPAAASLNGGCLICRDYSAPDAHAKRFPRQSIPSHDPAWLGRELTSPFPSHTDKARALFTWLHYNVVYDTVSYFSGNIKPSTPSGTIASGLAVCEGYAGLFSALALASGMEAVTVGGHGKGVSHSALAEGDPVPPVSHNHAWNAVRIDGGQWKLIDCCWGAGQLDCKTNQYNQNLAPERFTQSNEDFGKDHWPQDRRHFYRADGRALSWEEYMLQDAGRRKVYGNVQRDHGITTESIAPLKRLIRLNDASAPGPTLRFQMHKVCRHWRSETHGGGGGGDALFLLEIQGRDGRGKDMLPLDTDGFFHWVDVPRADLGAPGQTVRMLAVKTLDGKDARGLSKETYLARKGRCAMSWGYVADWELVH